MVNVSYAVPVDELTIDDLKSIRDASLAELENMIRSVGKNPEDYNVRDILPATDLGLPSESWSVSYTAANTWVRLVNITVPQNVFIVFYGYTNKSASPKTVAVKFYSGAVPVAIFQLEKLYTKREPTGYFKPLGFKEFERLAIEFYPRATGADEPTLLGFVAELRGTTIGERK